MNKQVKKKNRRIQITNIRSVGTLLFFREIKTILGKYCEQLYAIKLDNADEIQIPRKTKITKTDSRNRKSE